MALTEKISVTVAPDTTEITDSSPELTTIISEETTTSSFEQETTTSLFDTETTDTLIPQEITTIESTSPVTTASSAPTGVTLQTLPESETTTVEISTVPTIESTTLLQKTNIEDTTTSSSKDFEPTETTSTFEPQLTKLSTTSEISTTEVVTTLLPTTEIQTIKIITTEAFTSETPDDTSLPSINSTITEASYVITTTTVIPDLLTPTLSGITEYSTNKQVHFRNINVTTSTTKETEIDTTDSSEATSDSLGVNPDNDDSGGNGGTIAAIVISCVGAVCLVLLAGLLFVMRKRQKRFNYGQRCTPISLDDYSMDNASVNNSTRRKGLMRSSKRSYGNPAFEDPVSVNHPLNFPALVKFATNLEDIKAEFDDIPVITARTNELPEGCDTKNRYANVIPLPETRVFLRTIEGYPNSDYINANFVTGPKNIKGYYIACQAPLQNTVDDFWRMLWEQQCKVVLMLTHFFENGVEKCVDYLPPSEVLDCHRLFGDFQVTLKKREVKDKYVISIVQLKNMVSNCWREVTHFWYLGWPEKGVPNEANSLIAFLIEARSYMKSASIDRKDVINGDLNEGVNKNEVNPVVVHCSPGTGRTGVVIACDIAIREFEQTRLVDVPRIVYKIRRDRASAVQTKEQYAFIYKVISLYATKLTGGALDSF